MIRIDPARFLADLDALRGIGAVGSGVVRPAFSETDMTARRWLVERFAEAGLKPHFDPAGNLFGLPPGEGPFLLTGSHTDTQPEGGWLDGALGVIAGLEVARAALEQGGPPVAVVSFQDEEGRFGGLTGSRIWAGALPLADADTLTDAAGESFGDLRNRYPEMQGASLLDPALFRAFVELHIEQGPILDDAGEAAGVVEAIVGMRDLKLAFIGQQNHAGTTPMAVRRDAFQGLVRFATSLNAALAPLVTEATVWTIGSVAVAPNAASIVPGRVDFSVQWRDADAARLDRMEAAVRETAAAEARASGLGLETGAFTVLPPTAMNGTLVAALAEAAEEAAPGRWRRMISGALHDAASVSSLMPAAMLFAPSIGGVSHSFDEDTARDDLVTAAQTLAGGIARLAAPA